jgi:hypothetical protein
MLDLRSTLFPTGSGREGLEDGAVCCKDVWNLADLSLTVWATSWALKDS